jgi:hypothetical protein
MNICTSTYMAQINHVKTKNYCIIHGMETQNTILDVLALRTAYLCQTSFLVPLLLKRIVKITTGVCH